MCLFFSLQHRANLGELHSSIRERVCAWWVHARIGLPDHRMEIEQLTITTELIQ